MVMQKGNLVGGSEIDDSDTTDDDDSLETTLHASMFDGGWLL